MPAANAKPLRAFVISPIGRREGGVADVRREFADRVLDKILEPARREVKEQGFEFTLIRGDRDGKVGDVLSKLIQAITEDEIVIALLTEHDPTLVNANVFYELGVAHCAGRPVVILRHEKQAMPFDLGGKDHVVFEDHHLADGTDPNAPDSPVAKTAQLITRILQSREIYEKPFGQDLALGRPGARDRFQSVTFEQWSDMMLRANRHISLGGSTLNQLMDGRACFNLPDEQGDLKVCVNLQSLLAYQIGRGVDVNVLMLHEKNPLIECYVPPTDVHNQKARKQLVEKMRSDIAESHKNWKRAKAQVLFASREAVTSADRPDVKPGVFRLVKVRNGPIMHRICHTERRVLLTPYFITSAVNSGPCIDARAGTECHVQVGNDIEFLIKANEQYVEGVANGREFVGALKA
jgi:hypothetical protein